MVKFAAAIAGLRRLVVDPTRKLGREWRKPDLPPSARQVGEDDETVSVVIPSFQHARYIRDAVLSVARQTYPFVQLVIVDDGSTDDSLTVIDQAVRDGRFTDVVVEQQTNQGAHAAINRGIALSRGKYVSILNSDDVYHPDRIARLVDRAESTQAELMITRVTTVPTDPFGQLFADDHTTWFAELAEQPAFGFPLLHGNGACTTSNFFFTRDLAMRIGGFRDLVLVHDWDFLLRAVRHVEPEVLDEPLVFYRLHGSNTLRNRGTVARAHAEHRRVLIDYFRSVQLDGSTPNSRAPSPPNYGDYFFEFLSVPSRLSGRHWAYSELDHLWRSATVDLAGVWTELLPPADLMELVGSTTVDEFRAVGEEFFSYLVELAGLEPDDSVLDIGCGTGRMAIPLTRYLDASGSYCGFDIVPSAVAWCTEVLSARYPKFQFTVADVYNGFYNPTAEQTGAEYRFPYADNQFNFAFLTSVFTHVLPGELGNYVAELSRVLKPGARCLATFFLANPESVALINDGRSTLPFRNSAAGYWTISEERPELAVCYDEVELTALLAEHRLSVVKGPCYGSWCGRSDYLSYQDILILERSDAESP